MNIRVYDVAAVDVPVIEGRIKRANNRLSKAGINERFTSTVNYYEKFSTSRDGSTVKHSRARVTLDRPTIGYSGYKFLARVEKIGDEFLAFSAPGEELNGERPTSMECDHCKTNRQRKNVYLIEDEFGHRSVVGGNCLELYIGFAPPALWSLEWDDIAKFEDEDWIKKSHGSVTVYPTDDVVKVAYYLIKKFGYKNTSYGSISTKELIIDAFLGTDESLVEESKEIDAARICQLILDQVSGDMNDWAANVEAVVKSDYLEVRHFGILASGVWAAVKAEIKEVENSMFIDEFIGLPGDKFIDVECEVFSKKPFASAYGWNTTYGSDIVLCTSHGYRLFWRTTSNNIPEVGDKILASFTISKNDVYRDVYSSKVSRPTWAPLSR